MDRKRFVQYRTSQQKYNLKFFGLGIRRIFTDLRYTGIAILLVMLEIIAYYRICDMIDKVELWPALFQIYKKIIILPLAVFFLSAVMIIGRPRGFRRIMREIEKIPGDPERGQRSARPDFQKEEQGQKDGTLGF